MEAHKSKLSYLIKILHLNINEVNEDTEEGMDRRIRLQKIVYFSKQLGIDYNYSMYVHGPYSPQLTNDYYSLSEDDIRDAPSYRGINEIYPKIEELFKSETIWLETAATIISVKKVNPHLNWKYIIDHVSKIKSDILKGKGKDFNFVQEVFLDLKNLRLVDK